MKMLKIHSSKFKKLGKKQAFFFLWILSSKYWSVLACGITGFIYTLKRIYSTQYNRLQSITILLEMRNLRKKIYHMFQTASESQFTIRSFYPRQKTEWGLLLQENFWIWTHHTLYVLWYLGNLTEIIYLQSYLGDHGMPAWFIYNHLEIDYIIQIHANKSVCLP